MMKPNSLQSMLRHQRRVLAASRVGGGPSRLLLRQQQPAKNTQLIINKRFQSTEAAAASPAVEENVPIPSNEILRRHFFKQAVPMIGFGLMDQTVMLQAGNAIDCTLGVTFGLSTLTAAAMGQVCSDAAGVLFGGTLESFALALGLPKAGFSAAQRSLPIVKRVGLAGQLCGVILGCLLGLGNLLLIDTERSSTLKLQALTDEQEFAFEVEASNALREDATILTVRGPDVDGLLASMTAALTAKGCSLIELHAAKSAAMVEPSKASEEEPATTVTTTTITKKVSKDDDEEAKQDSKDDTLSESSSSSDKKKEISLATTIGSPSTPSSNVSNNNKSLDFTKDNNIEDVFVVVRGDKQIPDDELDELASALLEATFHPINVRSFKAHAQQLEDHNEELQKRVNKLEKLLQERQIKVVPKIMATSSSSDDDEGNDEADNDDDSNNNTTDVDSGIRKKKEKQVRPPAMA